MVPFAGDWDLTEAEEGAVQAVLNLHEREAETGSWPAIKFGATSHRIAAVGPGRRRPRSGRTIVHQHGADKNG